jgi:hypothetical protein
MDIPVLNKGYFLYNAKVNITSDEAEWVLEHKWYNHRGIPRNYRLGYLYDFIATWRTSGENLYSSGKYIPILYKSKIVAYSIVDMDDYCNIINYNWVLNRDGYAISTDIIPGSITSMHRYVTLFPVGLCVDHLFWNRLDNRKSVLRICDKSENNRNMARNRKIPNRMQAL